RRDRGLARGDRRCRAGRRGGDGRPRAAPAGARGGRPAAPARRAVRGGASAVRGRYRGTRRPRRRLLRRRPRPRPEPRHRRPERTMRRFLSEIPRSLIAFVAAYMLACGGLALGRGNVEFLIYAAAMLGFIALVLGLDVRVGFSRATLWLLTVWGGLHM